MYYVDVGSVWYGSCFFRYTVKGIILLNTLAKLLPILTVALF